MYKAMRITIAQLIGIEPPIEIRNKENRIVFKEDERGNYYRIYYRENMVLYIRNDHDYSVTVYDDDGIELYYNGYETIEGDMKYHEAAIQFMNDHTPVNGSI